METSSVPQPSISINKLGEFIYGSEAKKRSIVKTIKYPSTFINARYTAPKSAVIRFMLDSNHELTILNSKRNEIDHRKVETNWQKNNKLCCIKALDDLIICANSILIPFLNFQAQHGLPKEYCNKKIKGVSIHLNPDIILLDKDGKIIIGAIRLIFSKTREIEIKEGQIIAGLIKDHIEKCFATNLKESNCVVIDVFHKRCIPANKDFNLLEIKVKKACEEISQLWPQINKS